MIAYGCDLGPPGDAHSAVAPYAVRPRPNAPVATPLQWDELSESRTRTDRWTLRSVINRVRSEKPPAPPPTAEDVVLLREIRDALKK